MDRLTKYHYVIHINVHAASRYVERFEPELSIDQAKHKLEHIAREALIFARHRQIIRNNEVVLRNDEYPDVVLVAQEMGKELYVITCEVYSRPGFNWWKESINHETTKTDII